MCGFSFQVERAPVYWITLLSTSVLLVYGKTCHTDATEGHEAVLACNLSRGDQDIVWQVQEKEQFVNISFCNSAGACVNHRPSSFQARRATTPEEVAGGSHIYELRVISSNRNQALFRCIHVDGSEPLTCPLTVHVKPTVTIDLTDKFPLCPNGTFTYHLTCSTPSIGAVLLPLFTITINDKMVAEKKKGQYSTEWKSYFLVHTFRPESGGPLRMYCKVENTIFSELYDERDRREFVNEPPTLAPVLKTTDDQPALGSDLAYVTHGRNASLTCHAPGGYPEVMHTTIECDNDKNTALSNYAKLTTMIPHGSTRKRCHCLAAHITGCYNRRTDVVLVLQEPAQSFNDTPPASCPNSDSLTLGLGVGLGGVILVLVGLDIVFIILYRRKFARRKGMRRTIYSQPDCPSSNSAYQYSVVRAGAPQPPQLTPPNHPNHNLYDVIDHDTDVKYIPGSGSQAGLRGATLSRQDSETSDDYIQPIS